MRWLPVLSWPLWAKLLTAFTVMAVLPLVIVTTLTINGVREVSTRNNAIYLADLHEQQVRDIGQAVLDARRNLDTFIYDPEKRTLMLDILAADAIQDESVVYNQLQLMGAFQNDLLNPAETAFTRIELLNTSGDLLANVERGVSFGVAGSGNAESRANEPAFRAGQRGEIQGLRQILSLDIADDEELSLFIVNLLRSDTNTDLLGYMVAYVDYDEVINRYLLTSGDFGGIDNYLAVDNANLLTTEGLADPPSELRTSGVLARALAGRSDMETVGEGDAARLYRYAPVAGTPFALISIGPLEQVAPALIAYFQTRGFAVTIGVAMLVVVLVALVYQVLGAPLRKLRVSVQAIAGGDMDTPIPNTNRKDEIGALSSSVADLRSQVNLLVQSLEQQIITRENEMAATHEISHFAATQRDLQHMMAQVVELIVERFPHIYHAQIFLIDSEGDYAVLQASSGEIGRSLLERGHRLLIGSVSVIGQVIDQGQPIIARDTATSRVHRRNAFLPDTRAELAIPLTVAGRIIGALDVQSKQGDVFDEKQINTLEMLADQIAVAIDSARIYQEAMRRTEEAELERSAALYQSWREHMVGQRQRQLVTEAGVISSSAVMAGLRQRAIREGQPVVGAVTANDTIPFAVPIRLRGQTLGAAGWELPAAEFSQGKVQLAQELTDRLAISLDNARLFQESQRATERERMVNDIAARLTTRTDIDDILQTAVREVGQALRSPQVSIRLNGMQASNGNGGSNGNGNGNHGTNGKHA